MYKMPYPAEEIQELNTLNRYVKRILEMSTFAPTAEEVAKEHSESLAAQMKEDEDRHQRGNSGKKESKEEPIENKWTAKTMSLDTEFAFGKHRGKSLQEVIEDHLSYIDWAVDKEVIELDEEAFEYYSSGVKEVR